LALLLAMGVSASAANAQNSVKTSATTAILEGASFRVVDDAPFQALLVTGTIAPTGVTFTMATPDAGGFASLGMPGFVSGDGEAIAMTGSGLITGTTINGEALSVSVGGSFSNLPKDSNTGANGGISVVIAQYN
jgi:hypothetical protein